MAATRASNDPGKTQLVRLADVFFIGPLLIYAGTRQRLPAWLDLALVGVGLLTIGYNADNYLRIRAALDTSPPGRAPGAPPALPGT